MTNLTQPSSMPLNRMQFSLANGTAWFMFGGTPTITASPTDKIAYVLGATPAQFVVDQNFSIFKPGTYNITGGGLNMQIVPEPSTYALFVMTGAGALWWARRRHGQRPR